MKSRLKVEVEGLHKGPIEFSFDVMPEEFDLLGDPEFTFTENVSGEFTAKFVGGDNVVMIGRIRTRARAECVRCLHPLDYPIDIKVEAVFLPRPERIDEDMDPLEVEKLFYDSGVIYPMERFREEIMLQLPFLPGCELEDGDFCPVQGVRVDTRATFGPPEDAEDKPEPETKKAPEPTGVTWKDQLARVRKKIDGEGT